MAENESSSMNAAVSSKRSGGPVIVQALDDSCTPEKEIFTFVPDSSAAQKTPFMMLHNENSQSSGHRHCQETAELGAKSGSYLSEPTMTDSFAEPSCAIDCH